MMKKKVYSFTSLLLAMIMCASLLAGCSGNETPSENAQKETETVAPSTKLNKPPAEEQIISDLNSFELDVFEVNNTKATDCEIIKRQTNEEDKEDICYVRIICEGEYNCFEYQFRLNYVYYDVGGWILEDVGYENMDEWTETYIAADGNDLMESIIWLDESFTYDVFKQGTLGGGHYWGEIDGTHYLGVPVFDGDKWFGDFVVCDSNGNTLTGIIGKPLSQLNNKIQFIFFNKQGDVRFVVSGRNEDDTSNDYIVDEYGNQISDNYDSIWRPDSTEYNEEICITWDRETDYVGAIDLNGNLLLEQKYESWKEIYAELEIEWEENNTSTSNEEEIRDVIYEKEIKTANGEWEYEYYYEDGTPITFITERDLSISNLQYLLVEEIDEEFRYYDAYGNARTPYFTTISRKRGGTIFEYNGRCGILPDRCVAKNMILVEPME